jgi:hypothetical protein
MATSTVIRNTKALAERGVINHEVNGDGYSVWSINISEEPEPKAGPKNEPAARPAAQESMYEKAKVLAKVCRMDFESNKGMLLGHAKKLPISTEEILDLFGPEGTWYRLDFRGKKGSPPALKQVATEFLKLQQAEISLTQSLDAPSNSVIKNGELFV